MVSQIKKVNNFEDLTNLLRGKDTVEISEANVSYQDWTNLPIEEIVKKPWVANKSREKVLFYGKNGNNSFSFLKRNSPHIIQTYNFFEHNMKFHEGVIYEYGGGVISIGNYGTEDFRSEITKEKFYEFDILLREVGL